MTISARCTSAGKLQVIATTGASSSGPAMIKLVEASKTNLASPTESDNGGETEAAGTHGDGTTSTSPSGLIAELDNFDSGDQFAFVGGPAGTSPGGSGITTPSDNVSGQLVYAEGSGIGTNVNNVVALTWMAEDVTGTDEPPFGVPSGASCGFFAQALYPPGT